MGAECHSYGDYTELFNYLKEILIKEGDKNIGTYTILYSLLITENSKYQIYLGEYVKVTEIYMSIDINDDITNVDIQEIYLTIEPASGLTDAFIKTNEIYWITPVY